MRTITDHKLNGLNEALEITADVPGPGGASHNYTLTLSPPGRPVQQAAVLQFQNGPISSPEDMNGLTNETLMAVAIDRLRGFQYLRNPDGSFDFNSRGKFACRENAMQLTHLEEALMWAQKRTRDRLARGVEGKNAA